MQLLVEVSILLLATALAAPFGRVSRIGSVLAFVAIGIVIGPWGIRLISDSEHILHFSEMGVVFLLFIIGLELQPKRLWALRRLIFGAGTLQLVSTTACLFALLLVLEFSWQSALVIAYGLALSSTAFALRLLADNGQMQSPHGKLAFGVLLYQDLAVIPFLALIPLLVTTGVEVDNETYPAWLGPLVLVAFIVIARYLLVHFLRLVAWSKVQEAFTATALLLVLGSAAIMQTVGLSMGLGAFLAGVLVADSEYRHQLEADIEPFKALLLGLFFIAVGMSTNLGVVIDNLGLLLAVVSGLLLVKASLLYMLGRVFKLGNENAMKFAAYLCQGGEFGFVAFTLAANYQIISMNSKDLLIAAITLSMAMTPLVLKLVKRYLTGQNKTEEVSEFSLTDDQHNEIIIAGFGRFGQILGRILNSQDIRYTAVDPNPEQVKLVREFGNTVFYGDLANHKLLETAGINNARILAICIDDIEKSLKIAAMVRKHHPSVRLFARARNRLHEIKLRELGVEYVIREALMSSLDLSREILTSTGLDKERSEQIVSAFKAYDSRLLLEQAALMDDRASLIQSSHEAAEELKELLREENMSKRTS